MALLLKKLRSVSLPLKVAFGAVLTAFIIIFIVVGVFEDAFDDAFKSQLDSVLDERAFQHRVHFSQSVEAYSHAAKLLSTQRSLVEHLRLHLGEGTEHPLPIKGAAPYWLPNFSLLRSFIAPHYAVLFDSNGRMLDFYQNWPVAPPEEIMKPDPSNLVLAIGQTHIIMIGETPFLLAGEIVKDNDDDTIGTLLLATPLDESFMITTNGPATDWNLVALIDDSSGRVISSNSGATIAKGSPLDDLKEKHLFTEPEFLAIGGMELTFRFASFVEKDSIDLLSNSLLRKAKTIEFAEAFIYMSPFVCIIYWLTRRILRLTNKVEEFSLQNLGYNPSTQDVMGDQIDVLEQRFQQLTEDIKKRTLQLETANHEMEAFAYSVSHDLRAPLRSIDGFSLALDEDSRDQLDEAGRDYLLRIRKAAQRMGILIDEILMLSRLSRSAMKIQRVNLSSLAERAIHELRQNDPERDVEVKIAKGIEVIGDEGLLSIVITNLLDNAWKFTSKTEKPVIEFGEKSISAGDDLQSVHSRIYYVSDNGAGFDMAFVDKLFGAFQRLHRDTDFPGTGVGLATVQRIITRHEGAIWAEGEANKGARFFFTIQEAP